MKVCAQMESLYCYMLGDKVLYTVWLCIPEFYDSWLIDGTNNVENVVEFNDSDGRIMKFL
jgi:hypothetical protein